MSGKVAAFVLCLLLLACKQDGQIKLIYQQQKVMVTGIDVATLHGLQRDSLTQQAWENLFPVRLMPADAELKDEQSPIYGKYTISDSAITFSPDTPFEKGKAYFARYYRYDQEISKWDLILKRRQLGKAEYHEIIIKP